MLLFRNEVKARFNSQPHVYHQVIHLLSRYNLKSISIQQLQETVELLLHEHPDLVERFYSLAILFPSPPQDNHQMSEKAKSFFVKVKESHPAKYENFVSILCNFSNSSLKETCEQVQMLFKDEPSILREFESMVLPDIELKGDSNGWTKPKITPKKPSNLVLGSEKQRIPESLARSMSASDMLIRKKLPLPPTRASTWTGSQILDAAKTAASKAKEKGEMSSSTDASFLGGQRKGATTATTTSSATSATSATTETITATTTTTTAAETTTAAATTTTTTTTVVVPLGLVKARAKAYTDSISGGYRLSPQPKE